MALYFIIVSITMLCVISVSVAVSIATGIISLTYAIFAPFCVNFYTLIVLGLLALIMRLFIPFKAYNYSNKIYRVTKNEIKFYERLKIKSWKDKVPECGKSGGFSKKNLTSTNLNYIKKFLDETCFAEVLHALAGILSFTCLFFFPLKDYYFVLPILLVNLFLHILPCIIQRYNRFKLEIVYQFKLRKSDERIYQESNQC